MPVSAFELNDAAAGYHFFALSSLNRPAEMICARQKRTNDARQASSLRCQKKVKKAVTVICLLPSSLRVSHKDALEPARKLE